MIEFKVTGDTWKEILKKLEGMWPGIEKVPTGEPISDIIETTEKPTDEFKPEENKEFSQITTESPLETVPILPPAPLPPTKPISSPASVPVLPPTSSPTLPIVPGVKLDSAGHPWNPDVHTRTKAKNDDGTWRNKRKTPGFEKRSGPVIPQPGKVTTPTVPPSLRIDDLTKFAAYATKINTEKNLKDNIIRDYLISIGIPNILQIPKEKLPEVAETLKTHFGVEF